MLNTVTVSTTTAPTPALSSQTKFVNNVRMVLSNYFAQLDGEPPENLYSLLLSAIEAPLLETVMCLVCDNQSQAAKILGISRSTLRKKLALYKLAI